MDTDALIAKVTVVIRSVGERTEAVCRNLVAQQVPQENIVVVSNAPFSATLALAAVYLSCVAGRVAGRGTSTVRSSLPSRVTIMI